MMPKAKAAATEALEEAVDLSLPGQSDSTLAAVHTALACVKAVYDWSWTESERHFDLALEHDPKYPTAHHWYAMNWLVPMRRFEDAEREIRLAQESDPLSPAIQASLGLVHCFAGNLKEAVAQLEKTLDEDPGFAMAHYFLGQTYLQMSRPEDALGALGHASRLSPGRRSSRPGSDTRTPRQARGIGRVRILDELKERRRARYVSAALLAEVSAGLGETAEALSWLEEARRERSPEALMDRDAIRFPSASTPRLRRAAGNDRPRDGGSRTELSRSLESPRPRPASPPAGPGSGTTAGPLSHSSDRATVKFPNDRGAGGVSPGFAAPQRGSSEARPEAPDPHRPALPLEWPPGRRVPRSVHAVARR